MKNLTQIQTDIERLAKIIEAPLLMLPTYGKSEDFARPHIEVIGNEYNFVVVERGQELERRKTEDYDEFLFWVFDEITFSMATEKELKTRVENQDFRIHLFQIQEELIEKINPKYSVRLNTKHRKLLNVK